MNRLFLFVLVILFACSKKSDNVKSNQSISSYQFYGNYIPTKEIIVNDYTFESIEISTKDSLGGYFIDLIYLRFSNQDEEYHVAKNTSFSGTKDNFIIVADDSILGTLEIKGKFFGEKGPMYDDPENSKAIVFEGIFSVDGKNKKKLKCTYFEGD